MKSMRGAIRSVMDPGSFRGEDGEGRSESWKVVADAVKR
jgi:hypothetical protein